MDTEQQLFGLMTVAVEQQKAVQTALDGLSVERAALAKERAALSQASTHLGEVADGVRRAAAAAIPAIQKTTDEAVSVAVRHSLTGASEAAVQALGEAAKPVIGRLSGVVQAAAEAEGQLNGAVAAFGWKWALVAGGAAGGGIAAVLLAGWLSVWWQRDQVEQLTEQRQALNVDIVALQATAAALEKRGARIKLSQCGGRLCIEASTNQGETQENWRGPWKSAQGTPMVIPRGY
jgi:hypothetical protein